MEKIIYTKPLRMPDDRPGRTVDSIRVTKEDDLVTKVEKFTGLDWKDITGGGSGGDDNEAALRLLLSGKKINLGEITGTNSENLLPEEFKDFTVPDKISEKLFTWELTIPEGTTEIEDYAFSGSGGVGLLCAALNLPDGLVSIGDGAFQNLIDITDLIIPNSVQHVGSSAFCGCALLENVTYPMDAEYGDNVFKGTAIPDMLYSNTSILYVPNDVSGDIVIPEGVTAIPGQLFRDRSGITSIIFPSTITSLGESVFGGCTGMKTMIFENGSLESLGSQWFCGDSNGEEVDTRTNVVLKFDHVIPLSNTQGWNSNVLNYYVLDSLVDDYKAATNWSGMASKILPMSTAFVSKTEFYGVGESLTATTLLTSFAGQVTIDSATTESEVISNVAYDDNRLTFNIAQCEQQDVTFSITYHIGNSIEYTTSITVNVVVLATKLELADILGAAYATSDGDLYFDVESLNESGKTLQGILVTDGEHRYVMSKDNIKSVAYNGGGSDYEFWGGYNIEIDSDHYFDDNTKLSDFDGKGNTKRIVAALTESNHDDYFNVAPYSAAGLCAQYEFPNKAKAYMWAAGEENIAVKNKNLVKKLVEDVEGTATNALNNYIWSSTQYSSGSAWSCLFSGSGCSGGSKSNGDYVVPVCAFPFVSSSILLNGEEFNTYYKDSSATLTIESNFNNMTVQSVTSSNENVTVGELSEGQVTITFGDAEYSSVNLTVTLLNTDTNETVTDVHTVNIISEDEYTIFRVNHVGLVTKTGVLYKDVADWTTAGSEELQGILVTEGNHQFVASPDVARFDFGDGETDQIYWGGYQLKVPGIKTTSNTADALSDFDGQGNTAKIVAYLNEDTHDSYFQIAPYSAAGICANFEFSNGQKGYLWSAGEENIAVKYSDTISTILTDLSKSDWATNNYVWNSTQYSSDSAWGYYFNSSLWGNVGKGNHGYVVPVCAYPLTSSSL